MKLILNLSVGSSLRKLENFKYDTNRKIGRIFKDLWIQLGKIGLNFLNIIPKLGKVIYEFFGDLFTDLFHGIYNQQIEPQKAKKVIIAITLTAVITTLGFSGINYFAKDNLAFKKDEPKKEVKIPEIQKKQPEIKKKEVKKPEIKKEVKKPQKKEKQKLEVKKKNVDEVILPNLNLKTETVLNLFKDVEYDLGKVRTQKLVKPIYFTQFPRDLD